MSAWVYRTVDGVVWKGPCRLISVTVGNDGGNTDTVTLYDEFGAETNRIIATIFCESNATTQVRWTGLELQRGLYVDLGSNIEYVTIEFEVVGSSPD